MQTYSLAQVQAFTASIERLQRRQMLQAALASRAATADEKGWKRFVRMIGL